MVQMSGRRQDAVWDDRRLQHPHAQPDKAGRVRRMFDAIAPTYELINTLASGGRDAYWRREMVRLAEVRRNDVLLDVACGTGDVARAFAGAEDKGVPPGARPARIVGLDFSPAMLQRAVSRPIERCVFSQGDALRLPIADASVSIVTCAFGIRNFQDLGAGLGEMCRVLRAGGRAVILEFSVPTRAVRRRLYVFYATRLMPMLAGLISGDRTGAYRYLPSSVLSFQQGEELVSSFRASGFAEVRANPLTWGIVTVYVARKAGE